jgi:hypothetical protein
MNRVWGGDRAGDDWGKKENTRPPCWQKSLFLTARFSLHLPPSHHEFMILGSSDLCFFLFFLFKAAIDCTLQLALALALPRRL